MIFIIHGSYQKSIVLNIAIVSLEMVLFIIQEKIQIH